MCGEAPEQLTLTGQILLAMPGIGDPRFDQAAIMLCMHDAGGALGIGIGRTLANFDLHQLLSQLDIAPGKAPLAPIHYGGPVDPQRGFVLHSPEWEGEDTLTVTEALALTTTLDVLRAIADGSGPERWLVALGYAGWAAGQLDEELRRHGWFHVETGSDLVFDGDSDDRWSRAFASVGIDSRLLATSSGRA